MRRTVARIGKALLRPAGLRLSRDPPQHFRRFGHRSAAQRQETAGGISVHQALFQAKSGSVMING